MTLRDASIALRRFGLGPRPGEIARIAADPRAFVLAQLRQPESSRIAPELPPSFQILSEVQVARRAVKEARQLGKAKAGVASVAQLPAAGGARPGAAGPPRPGPTTAVPPAAGNAAVPPEAKPGRLLREAFLADLDARIAHASTTPAPFLERLVLFWSDHFSVSAAKGPVRGIAGAFEREAIRPHVVGRFADMLKAVAQHPAMLIYLDNAQSIGPQSIVGKRRTRGLNENLAREILELHTLGVDGGYTQADVTNFARLLTGWSVGQIELPQSQAGRFFFAAPRHEPGAWRVLGWTYDKGGVGDGEAVLANLARHPATARHIATKLARYFVADAPPPALVASLERAWRETDGDLGAVAQALASAPEAWSPAPAKIVPPYDFLVSLVRGVMPSPPARAVARLSAALGQPIWAPASPKGWPSEDNAWTGPAAIRERLRIAEQTARQLGPRIGDPRALAEDLLGGALRAETREAVARAETREQGLELIVMSPEFQRR